jgi:hypothetical protein
MKNIFLTIAIILCSFLAQAIKVVDIKVKLDTSRFGIENYFSMDLTLIGKYGGIYELHKNDEDFKWDKFSVKGQHIKLFSRGIVEFNQNQITELDNEIQFELIYKDSVYFRQKIKLPYVKSLQINNRNIIVNSDLNILDYLLVFNNGKIQKPSPRLFEIEDIINASNELAISNGFLKMTSSSVISANNVELVLINKFSNILMARKSLKISYENQVTIESNGRSGRNGNSGNSSNRISENGGNGTDGENGEDAMPVDVFAKTVRKDSVDIVLIRAILKDGRSTNYIIELNENTQINIFANGGNGGNGGKGGAGGEGNTESPRGGNGGIGGNCGYGGKGANVNVYLDEFSEELKSKINIDNRNGLSGVAGEGGAGGSGNNDSNSLLGLILNTNRGSDGKKGQNAVNSTYKFNKNIQVLSTVEWEKLANQIR